jgi:integrase
MWVILDGGRKISTGCPENAGIAAQKRLAEYIAQKHEAPRERRASSALIANVLLHYLKHRVPQLAAPKWEAYRLEKLGEFFGERRVSEITGKLCRDYVSWRKEQGVGPSSRRELDVLSAAIGFYHKEFQLDVVPVITKPEPALAREGWLTRDQAAALLWAAYRAPESKHLVRFILIGLYTGTRTSAILGLRWMRSPHAGSIDLENGILYRRGVRAKETKKRQPAARLHWRLIPHLRRWRAQDDVQGLTHVITYRGKPVEKLRRSWDQACKRASIPDDIVKHSLRHTAATWLMQKGVPVWEAAGYLGMTVETLERVYGHHHPDFQSNAAGRRDIIPMGMKRA